MKRILTILPLSLLVAGASLKAMDKPGLWLHKAAYAVGLSQPNYQEAKELFFNALLNLDITSIQNLLKEFPALANETDERNELALHLAILRHAWIAQNPANVDATNKAKQIIQILLDANAHIEVKDPSGTALQCVVHCFFERSSERVSDILQMLLDLGADVNCKDNDGNTPLMQLIKHSYSSANVHRVPDILQMLLNSGADVNCQDHDGNTPLMQLMKSSSPYYSAQFNDLNASLGFDKICSKFIPLLLAYGANTEIKNNAGNTALEIAQRYHEDQESENLKKLFESYNKQKLA